MRKVVPPTVLLAILLLLFTFTTIGFAEKSSVEKPAEVSSAMLDLLKELETHPCALDSDNDGVVDCSDDSPSGHVYFKPVRFEILEPKQRASNTGILEFLRSFSQDEAD